MFYKKLSRYPNITDLEIQTVWVSAIIAPTTYYQALAAHIPEELKTRVHFVPHDCKYIWEWTEKVYEYLKKLNGRS